MASVRRQNKSGRIRSVLFILIAFIIGYSTANFFSFSEFSKWVSSKKSVPAQLASKSKNSNAKPLPKPKFEFYTLLTEENKLTGKTKKMIKPVNNKNTLATVQESKGKKALPPKANHQFYVQAASFRKQQDADRLKAKLALNGFEVKLVKIQSNGTHWYRVMLGPFDNQIKAEQAQTQMAQAEHIMGILRKEPKEIA